MRYAVVQPPRSGSNEDQLIASAEMNADPPDAISFYLESGVKWCGSATREPVSADALREVVYEECFEDVEVQIERAGFVCMRFGSPDEVAAPDFMFDFSSREPHPRMRQVELANCLLFFVRESYLSIQQIHMEPQYLTPRDRVLTASDGKRFQRRPPLRPIDEDLRVSESGLVHMVNLPTLSEAGRRLASMRDATGSQPIVAMVAESVWAEDAHRAPTALALGFSAAEVLMRRLHRRKLGSPGKSKAERLCSQLRKHGVIDPELFDFLEEARDARNGWLHENARPSQWEASKAVLAARMLLADDLAYQRPSERRVSEGP